MGPPRARGVSETPGPVQPGGVVWQSRNASMRHRALGRDTEVPHEHPWLHLDRGAARTQGLHRPAGNCLFSCSGRARGAGGRGCHQHAVTARAGPRPPVRAGQQAWSWCRQRVGVSGEHHSPKPAWAALGVPTPCVTPREDLLIVPLQDMGWKKEVMRRLVPCDTHLPDSSSPANTAGAGAAGAVCGQ